VHGPGSQRPVWRRPVRHPRVPERPGPLRLPGTAERPAEPKRETNRELSELITSFSRLEQPIGAPVCPIPLLTGRLFRLAKAGADRRMPLPSLFDRRNLQLWFAFVSPDHVARALPLDDRRPSRLGPPAQATGSDCPTQGGPTRATDDRRPRSDPAADREGARGSRSADGRGDGREDRESEAYQVRLSACDTELRNVCERLTALR